MNHTNAFVGGCKMIRMVVSTLVLSLGVTASALVMEASKDAGFSPEVARRRVRTLSCSGDELFGEAGSTHLRTAEDMVGWLQKLEVQGLLKKVDPAKPLMGRCDVTHVSPLVSQDTSTQGQTYGAYFASHPLLFVPSKEEDPTILCASPFGLFTLSLNVSPASHDLFQDVSDSVQLWGESFDESDASNNRDVIAPSLLSRPSLTCLSHDTQQSWRSRLQESYRLYALKKHPDHVIDAPTLLRERFCALQTPYEEEQTFATITLRPCFLPDTPFACKWPISLSSKTAYAWPECKGKDIWKAYEERLRQVVAKRKDAKGR